MKFAVFSQSRFAVDFVQYGTRLHTIVLLYGTFEEAVLKVFLSREQGRKLSCA